MHFIEINNQKEAEREFRKIGSDQAGARIMIPKAFFKIIKIDGLAPAPINIIKQLMLSLGGEVAAERGVITHATPKSAILIMGTLKQFNGLIIKLKKHQFNLPRIASEIEEMLKKYFGTVKLQIGNKNYPIGKRTYLMGIINLTPDSFYDGGKFSDLSNAYAHALKLIGSGADLIDIGGESSRPGSDPVDPKEEINRVVPLIKKIARRVPVSIDTRKASVARAALDAGAVMVNDISGLRFDKKIATVIKEFNASVVIMHIKGTPKNMQDNPQYSDLIEEIHSYLKEGLEIAKNAGILNDRIIVDPGFGFGKAKNHNLDILKRLNELKSLGRPILIGTSRKSTIGKMLNCPPEACLFGTAATVAAAIINGADFVRVHDVDEMKKIAIMCDAIIRGSEDGEKRKES